MKVKIFRCNFLNKNLPNDEKEINSFLIGKNVKFITQSETSDVESYTLTIAIWYEEKK